MAGGYKLQGQLQNERRELIEGLRLRSELLLARLALARNYLNSNEPQVALQVLDEASPSQGNLLPLLIERNWTLLAMNDLAAQRTALDAALAAGRYPALVVQQALLQRAGGDYPGAKASAEEVLKADPGDLRTARILVEKLRGAEPGPKALERLAQLAETAPHPAPLRHMLGLGLLARGELVRGRTELEAALRADPGFADSALALADLDCKQKQFDVARARLQTLPAKPGNLGAMLLLAEVEKSAGNRPRVVALYREVLAVDSANLIALNNISGELAPGRPEEAFAFAQRALEIAPDNSAVQDTLGWIYFRKGEYRTAARYLKLAVSWPSPGIRARGVSFIWRYRISSPANADSGRSCCKLPSARIPASEPCRWTGKYIRSI